MLLRAFFALFLIALLSEAIVTGAATLARAEISRRAGEVAQTQIAGATQNAQTAIASQLQAGSAQGPETFPSPAPVSTCAKTSNQGCLMNAQTTVQFLAPQVTSGGSCSAGTSCTVYEQGNDAVVERRAYAKITATITDTGNAVLATRVAIVAFRLFDEAPYAAVAGVQDASVSGVSSSAVGDDAGSAANATLLHVQYQNSQTGTRSSGDVWNAQNQSSAQAASAWNN